MFQATGRTLCDAAPAELDYPWTGGAAADAATVWAHETSGSGGYADHLFRYAAKQLFGIHVDAIVYRNLRNPDFREAILERDGQVLLRFAVANGFRNIQNLVQKLKRGKSAYHYVEVMACPSGCLNGGAQTRPEPGTTARDHLQQVEALHASLPRADPETGDALEVRASLPDAETMLHTSYHAVEKMNTALNIKW